MSEGRKPLEQRPKTGRSRTGIPRAIVRRDVFDNSITPFAAQTALQQPVAAQQRPAIVSTSNTNTDSDEDDAPRTIAAGVSEYTHGGELIKRVRPSDSSTNSDEQEDKRVKLTRPALLQASKFVTDSPRSPSPSPPATRPSPPLTQTRPPTPPSAAPPRREEPAPVAAPRTAPLTSQRAPSRSQEEGESERSLSHTHSARISPTTHQESASWPKDSTSYAGLPSPTGDVLMRPISPQPSTSYAAAASTPAPPRHPTPPVVLIPPTATAQTQPIPRSAYPPIVVECLPNWIRHFQVLGGLLGHAPNARPFGKGVRFLPKTADEFRAVQRYLTEAAAKDSTISWYCYSPAAEIPVKVAIRGLPLETPVEEVIAALREIGYPAEAARAIPPARGTSRCTYYVRLAHLTEEELKNLYKTTELLMMPQITIEAWRGGTKPPQCHRCQLYNHSSFRCHRPVRCIRCAGPHLVRDCQRSRDEPPTCANCGQDHAANDRRCVHYKREARRRGLLQPPPPSRPQRQPRTTTDARSQPTAPARGEAAPVAAPNAAAPSVPIELPMANTARAPTMTHEAAPTTAASEPTTLAAAANPPTERGRAARGQRRRRIRAPRPARSEPAAASTPQPRQPRATHTAAPQAPRDGAPTQAPATTSVPGETGTAPRVARPNAEPRAAPSVTQETTARAPSVEQRSQGEAQSSPDIMAIVRAVMEALMAGLTAYLQGQGALPALAAGMAVLARLHAT